jgi:hypothetical protein
MKQEAHEPKTWEDTTRIAYNGQVLEHVAGLPEVYG